MIIMIFSVKVSVQLKGRELIDVHVMGSWFIRTHRLQSIEQSQQKDINHGRKSLWEMRETAYNANHPIHPTKNGR